MEAKHKNKKLSLAFVLISVVAVGGIFGTIYFYKKPVECPPVTNCITRIPSNYDKTKDDNNLNSLISSKENEIKYNYFKLIVSKMLDGFINLNTYLQFADLPDGFTLDNVKIKSLGEVLTKYFYEFGQQKPNDEMEIVDGLGYIHIIIEKEKVDYLMKKYFDLDTYQLTDDDYYQEIELDGIKYYQRPWPAFGLDASSYLSVIDKKYNSDGTTTVYVEKHIIEYINETIQKIEITLNSNFNIQRVKYLSE